jgi:hypothetical protein
MTYIYIHTHRPADLIGAKHPHQKLLEHFDTHIHTYTYIHTHRPSDFEGANHPHLKLLELLNSNVHNTTVTLIPQRVPTVQGTDRQDMAAGSNVAATSFLTLDDGRRGGLVRYREEVRGVCACMCVHIRIIKAGKVVTIISLLLRDNGIYIYIYIYIYTREADLQSTPMAAIISRQCIVSSCTYVRIHTYINAHTHRIRGKAILARLKPRKRVACGGKAWVF